MCGIAGIVAYATAAPSPDERELVRIRDAMTARGPDGSGLWREPEGRVILGHRRLAIIDVTDASAQPMASEDGRLVVVFNGEIYNYRSLRAELIEGGAQMRTSGDTEVLLHLFRRHGAAMVDRLEGMFAIAIWDRRDRKLFVARDPHGIKPLYYADDGQTFRFASSVKALLAGGAISRSPDPAGIVGYLGLGSVPWPRTLLKAIRSLPAGHTAWVTERGLEQLKRYWSPARVYAAAQQTAPMLDREGIAQLAREELRASICKHLVADVPVGLFLSAGFDSGALLGIASELHAGHVRTVTLAFDEFRGTHDDEAVVAEQVAREYGAQHTTFRLGVHEARAGMSSFLQAMDQPTVDGLNTFWVSHAVRASGLKAAMSGLGGDELLGGYSYFARYVSLRRWSALAPSGWTDSMVDSALRFMPESRRSAKYAYMARAMRSPESLYYLLRGVFTPREVRSWVTPELWAAAEGDQALLGPVREAWDTMPGDAWAQYAAAEQSLYMRNQLMRDADWASMAHGLEVRVPMVDRVLTERLGTAVARTSGVFGKAPLVSAPSHPLPGFVTSRAKTGFSLPMHSWVIQLLRDASVPLPPDWLLGQDRDKASRKLVQDLEADRIHWSRPWVLLVLGNYVKELGIG